MAMVSTINNPNIIIRKNQMRSEMTSMPNKNYADENTLEEGKIKIPSKKLYDTYQKLYKRGDKFISRCTDDKDDGKLSAGEKIKCFAKGFVDHFTEGFRTIKSLIKKHPKETIIAALLCIGCGALAIATVGAPVLVAGVSILGIGLGVAGIIKDIENIIKGIKQAKNSTTDAEAKQAYFDIGNNSADIAQNAVEIYGGCKGLSGSVKAIKGAKITTDGDKIMNNIDDVIERTIKDNLSSDEVQVIKDSIGHTGEFANNAMPFLQVMADKKAITAIVNSNQ